MPRCIRKRLPDSWSPDQGRPSRRLVEMSQQAASQASSINPALEKLSPHPVGYVPLFPEPHHFSHNLPSLSNTSHHFLSYPLPHTTGILISIKKNSSNFFLGSQHKIADGREGREREEWGREKTETEGGREGRKQKLKEEELPDVRWPITQPLPPVLTAVISTYNLNVSFHSGLREHLMVLVFCLLSLLGSGISFSFT